MMKILSIVFVAALLVPFAYAVDRHAGSPAGVAGSMGADFFDEVVGIDAWSWGVSRDVPMGPGGSPSGPEFSEVTVVKEFGVTSPQIYSRATSGQHIPLLALTHTSSSDGVEILLENAVISGVEVETQDDGSIQETLSIAFNSIEVQYYDQAGIAVGEPFTWNLLTQSS